MLVSNLELGISSWLWAEDDLLNGMAMLKEYGITNIEISSMEPAIDSRGKEFLSGLRQCVSVNDLKVVQTHPSGEMHDLSVDGTTNPVEHLKDWVKDFVEYDKPVLVLHISEVFSLADDRRSKIEIFKKNLLELMDFCEKWDTKVALETMWDLAAQTKKQSLLGETEEEFLEIVNSVKSRYLGIHIDTGHSYLLGNLTRMVELAGDRLFALHVHDNHGKREGPSWDEHLIPGEGDIDWKGFVSVLKSIDYSGTFLLEVPPSGATDERLQEILRQMRKLQEAG